MFSRLGLVLVFVACRSADDPTDTAAPCPAASADVADGAYMVVPPAVLASVEVVDGQTWRVVADGDCIEPDQGDVLCPVWDFSADHEVVDGYLSTIGSGTSGFVVNLTDRDWRVYLTEAED